MAGIPTAQIVVCPAEGRLEECRDTLDTVLAYGFKNGNVLGEPVIGYESGAFVATFHVPRADSFHDANMPALLREELKLLHDLAASPPDIRVRAAQEKTADWRNANALYVFTHAFDIASPVCVEADGSPVPLYDLPISFTEREEIVAWADSYRCHDRIALDCGELEIPAYNQLASLSSQLAVTGRAICTTLEARTGKPTYYYLHRYWGFELGEEQRPCPGCGKAWKNERQRDSGLSSHDFICVPCRLASNLADCVDSEDLARIGAYEGQLR